MPTLKIGARGSKLSLAQTNQNLNKLKEVFPELNFEIIPFKTAGDIDKKTSLNAESIPDNFFSDTLDEAVAKGELDAAVHSAKDLPEYDHERITWFFLPWVEDNRDCLIFRKDGVIPNKPKVGVSSDSRNTYAIKRWPNAELVQIRGDIENRIEQLDRGEVDIILLAIAGLNRLGLKDRISEIIPPHEIKTHEMQGKISVTFKPGHPVMHKIRRMLTPKITICGAGTGKDGNYTHAVTEALETCDVCIKDNLLENEILNYCSGEVIELGKRYNDNAKEVQHTIHKQILNWSCSGKKVVRLKGGDPALFGRLTEELDILEKHQLAYQVLPGIPWLCSATLKHGIMVTSREETRHFTVATATQIEGHAFEPDQLKKLSDGSLFFYMGTRKLKHIQQALIEHGISSKTPFAIFKDTDKDDSIVRGYLEKMPELFEKSKLEAPALILIGQAADPKKCYLDLESPLNKIKVLCTGTHKTYQQLKKSISKLGGNALHYPLFELEPNEITWLDSFYECDWVVLASGSSASIFLDLLKKQQIDLRLCPHIATTGPSASKVLKEAGIQPNFQSSTFTSKALAEELIAKDCAQGQHFLVFRSSASQSPLTTMLENAGAKVDNFDLYSNKPIQSNDKIPDFDYITFCSPSAVKCFIDKFPEGLKEKKVVSIGPVTTACLKEYNITPLEPKTFDVEHMSCRIASHFLWQ